MRFVIDPSLHSITSYISVAFVRVTLTSNAKADASSIDRLKEDALSSLLAKCSSSPELEGVDSIRDWLKLYKAMGLKPKKTKPTHYALALRLVKDKCWPRAIGPLVDIYLTNQIKHLMPHGGFDVARLSGDTINLLVAEKEHTFQRLGVQEGDTDNLEKTKPGEVLYLDYNTDKTVTLTRHLNYRDAEPTKIVDDASDESKSTRDFILLIEGLDSTADGRLNLKKTAEDLEKAYRLVYGSEVERSYVRIVESDLKKEVSLSLDY